MKNQIVKPLLAFVVIFSLAALSGCQKNATQHKRPRIETPNSPQAIRLNMQSEPLSLDPRIGGDRRSQLILMMLFEGLTRIGPDNQPHPALAQEIEISADQKSYTFHLREAFWSNGQPISARDFEYAWKSVMAPHFQTAFAYAFYPILNAQAAKEGLVSLDTVGVRAVDSHTLVVELEHPAPYFLDLVANPIFSPVSREIACNNDNWAKGAGNHYCSSGPFRMTGWDHGRELRLESNPYYWDAGSVRLDGVTVTMVDDSQTVLSMFERGELDWAGEPLSELPLDALPALRDAGRLVTRSTGGIFQYKFNTERAPFDSIKMRQAFSFAIDRQALVDSVMQGGESVADSLLPPTLTLSEERFFSDFDLALARQLFEEGLEESGYTRDNFPAIVLSYSTIEGHKAIAQAVQQQWQEAFAIPVALESNEWNVYFSRFVARDFQVGAATWYSWYNDPIYNLEHVKYKEKRYNATQWEHPDYVALLDGADQELATMTRTEKLRQAEALVMEEMPLAPVFVTTYKYVASEDLHDVFISDLGRVDFKWAWRGE